MGGNVRTVAAVFIGTALLGGAFLFRDTTAGRQEAAVGAIVVTRGAEKQYHETKDSGGDGMRDWEEELRGTDPLVPDAPAEEITEEENDKPAEAQGFGSDTTSDTAADRFARAFFEQYFRAKESGGEITESERQRLVDSSVALAEQEARDSLFTQAHIRVGANDAIVAQREYGNAVGDIMQRYTVPNENEVAILGKALETNDPAELSRLEPIIAAYQSMLNDTLATEVPPSLVKEHLDLLNTLNAILNSVQLMQRAFDDPFSALLRIRRYEDDATGLYYAIDNMRTAFEQAGVIYTQDEPGLFFFSLRP